MHRNQKNLQSCFSEKLGTDRKMHKSNGKTKKLHCVGVKKEIFKIYNQKQFYQTKIKKKGKEPLYLITLESSYMSSFT